MYVIFLLCPVSIIARLLGIFVGETVADPGQLVLGVLDRRTPVGGV